MLDIHAILHHFFHKRLTFSVFFRIWLSIAIVVILASGLAFYQLQKSIKPSAQRVVEDTLVDISRMLAVTLGIAMENGQIQNPHFQWHLAHAFTEFDKPIWYDQKTHSQLHVYITNQHGFVIYDSKGKNVGKDFSRWNDIYLTLQGKYGARATRSDPNNPDTSVMYVASPIYNSQNKLIGIVSVGKPVLTLNPYINASKDEMIKTMLYITALVLLFSVLVAFWLRYSIQTVNHYTQHLFRNTQSKPQNPPHFYLGKELNELVATIEEMKHAIENKAYVTDYVHTLTHELKSPLTAIRASGELLSEDLPIHDREQFSQTILQQSDKLQLLVERLLILAKIEQPNFKLTLKPHDLTTLTKLCFNNQQAWLQQKQLLWQIISEPNIVCSIDKFWLQQALQNLIDNAIKFAENWIIVIIHQTEKITQIYLLNDCSPIPDYVLEKAFDRYFSFNQTNIDKNQPYIKGTGLGLTLVKQTIEHHHGTVKIYQDILQNIIDKIYQKPPLHSLENWLNQHNIHKNNHTICVKIQLPR